MEKPVNIRQIARQLVIMQRQLAMLVEATHAMLEEEPPVRKVRPSITLNVGGKQMSVGKRKKGR